MFLVCKNFIKNFFKVMVIVLAPPLYADINLNTNVVTPIRPNTIAPGNALMTPEKASQIKKFTNPNLNAPNPQTMTDQSDTGISRNIQGKISADPTLLGANVTISTSKGIVTLEGSVRSAAQFNSAIQAASSVLGVKEVKSKLTIVNPNAPQ